MVGGVCLKEEGVCLKEEQDNDSAAVVSRTEEQFLSFTEYGVCATLIVSVILNGEGAVRLGLRDAIYWRFHDASLTGRLCGLESGLIKHG